MVAVQAVHAAQAGERYLPSIRESSRRGEAAPTGFRPSPARLRRVRAAAAKPLACDRAPILFDMARRAFFRDASARVSPLQRHYSPAALGAFRRPVRSVFADHQLLPQQGMVRTLAPRHESVTTKILSKTLAAIGLEATFPPCHYPPIPPLLRHEPHARDVLRQVPGSDRGQGNHPVASI